MIDQQRFVLGKKKAAMLQGHFATAEVPEPISIEQLEAIENVLQMLSGVVAVQSARKSASRSDPVLRSWTGRSTPVWMSLKKKRVARAVHRLLIDMAVAAAKDVRIARKLRRIKTVRRVLRWAFYLTEPLADRPKRNGRPPDATLRFAMERLCEIFQALGLPIRRNDHCRSLLKQVISWVRPGTSSTTIDHFIQTWTPCPPDEDTIDKW